MPKHIVSGDAALHKLLEGVNLIANSVKATLGPFGKNTVYERLGNNLPVSTRDGVTVANQIESSDPFAQMGVAMIQGVAREAVDQSGDGTTTAVLLAQAIFAEGCKAISVGGNSVAIKRGIEKATAAIVRSLTTMAVAVSGDMLRQVATISANNDSALGTLIADAIQKAGPDGVVAVEASQAPESSLVVTDGMELGTGYISPYFINRPDRAECVLEDVAIFLHERKLAAIIPMREILSQLAKSGRRFMVIAEDVTDEALSTLSISAQQGPLRCVALRTPGSVEILHDVAALTGARVLTELLGVRLQNVGMDFLGTARKVIVKSQSATIIADGGERKEKRMAELRQQVTDATDEGSRMRLQARLARLAGGVAVIRVGAATELELNERKDRIEDALHATRCAEKEGVVPGGGIALIRAAATFKGFDSPFGVSDDEDERTGNKIVFKACEAPLRTLAENVGASSDYIMKTIAEGATISGAAIDHGWNARTNEFGYLYEMGIIDPLRVVRVALESAASVAALMIITHTLVSQGREK